MDLNTRNKNSSQNKNTGSSQDLKDQVADAGAEIKQRAGDVLRASTDTAREKFKEAADAAKDAAAGAADRFQDQAREQQRSAAYASAWRPSFRRGIDRAWRRCGRDLTLTCWILAGRFVGCRNLAEAAHWQPEKQRCE
jgi:hypothetical protein